MIEAPERCPWLKRKSFTLPKFNMDPKNDGVPKGISYSRVSCSGSMLNFGRVIKHIYFNYILVGGLNPSEKIVKLDHLTRDSG